MKPDVTAPGVDILSSLPRNQWSNHDWSGTSMAAPHVAGAAALLKQRHPTWTVEQIKSALESTGDPCTRQARPRRSRCCARAAAGSTSPAPTTRSSSPIRPASRSGSCSAARRATQTLARRPMPAADPHRGPSTVAPQASLNGVDALATPTVAAREARVTITLTVAADCGRRRRGRLRAPDARDRRATRARTGSASRRRSSAASRT